MAIQFCEDCGDLLPISLSAAVNCECCGKAAENSALSHTQTTTSTNFPSVLRDKLTSNIQQVTAQDSRDTQQRTTTECPKCFKQELVFSQAQLRSADEGTTIFYNCKNCNYRFTENN